MTKEDLTKYTLPDAPGVYIFKHDSDILYIGKATSLKDRTRSYFMPDVIDTRGPLIVDMVFKANKLEWQLSDSVLEALLLEGQLIKKHQPYYNSKEKDDKSYNFVVVTKEDYPRVLVVRGRELEQRFPHNDRKYTFGPFPHGLQLKEAMKLIRKIFPYRDKCIPLEEIPVEKREKVRGCFNSQIGLCSGVCMGAVTKKEYGRMINNLKLFFEGKKSTLIKNLEREMKMYAKAHQFEKAEKVKRQLYAINHIQDVALLKRETVQETADSSRVVFRIEAYDIAHMSGGNTVGAMTVVEDSEAIPSEYRKFKIRSYTGPHDIAGLKEVLRRRLRHSEWQLPSLIVVDGGTAQRNAAEEIIAQYELAIPVAAVTKDATHKAKMIVGEEALISLHKNAIILANSEAHRFAIGYHRKLRKKMFTPD